MSGGRLQRSQNAMAGGVCAGIAERLGVDAVVVRTLVVVLCLMTCGLGVLVYVIMWLALPLAPDQPHPVDVQPHEVSSETYGEVGAPSRYVRPSRVHGTSADKQGEQASAARDVAPRSDIYTAAGHEPPMPPLAARAAAAMVASQLSAGVSLSAFEDARSVTAGETAGRFEGAFHGRVVPEGQGAREPQGDVARADEPQTGAAEAVQSPSGETPPPRGSSLPALARTALLWICFAAAFVGLLRLLGFFVQGTSWWRFWPMFFVLAGIAVMVVPGKPGVRMARAITGWCLFVAGFVVLPMSVGLVRWASLLPWLCTLWPFLVCALAFLTVGWIKRSWHWALAAGVLFTVFCVAGLLVYAEPGFATSVVVNLPLGRTLEFTYPFPQ